MAQSPTQRINELARLTATLDERLDGVRRDVENHHARMLKIEDSLHDAKRVLAVLEERLNELKKSGEEGGRKRWAVVPSLVAAIVGSILTFLSQYAFRRFFP